MRKMITVLATALLAASLMTVQAEARGGGGGGGGGGVVSRSFGVGVSSGARARNVNASAALVALVPPAVVTVTSTFPDPAGEVATIDVGDSTLKAALDAPKRTAVAPLRFVPVIVTVVPPASGPSAGETAVTVGGGVAT